MIISEDMVSLIAILATLLFVSFVFVFTIWWLWWLERSKSNIVIREYKRVLHRAYRKHPRKKYTICNGFEEISIFVNNISLEYGMSNFDKDGNMSTSYYIKLPFNVSDTDNKIRLQLTDQRASITAKEEFNNNPDLEIGLIEPNLIRLTVPGELMSCIPPLQFTVAILNIDITEPVIISLRPISIIHSIFKDPEV